MSSTLPPGAIADDEEPQQWHALPASTSAGADAAEAAAEEHDADDADAELDEEMDEEDDDGDEEEQPWLGVHGGAAEEEAEEEDVAESAAVSAYAADAPVEEELEADDAQEEDEQEQPQAGDLTAAFFSELSESRAEHARKRRRGAAGADGDDSDEDYGVQQARAFAIPNHLMRSYDPNSTAPPASAEEYLLRVRMEAAACPRVKVSNIDPRAYAHRQTAYVPDMGSVPRPANDACLPSEEWQNEYAAEFAQARQQLLCFAANHAELRRQGAAQAGAPSKRDFTAWIPYCVGNINQQLAAAAATPASSAAASSTSATASAAVGVQAHYPTLALVVGMDQVQTKGIVLQLLQLAVDTIRKRQHAAEKHEQAVAAAAASTSDSAAPPAPLPPFPFPTHAYTLWLSTLLLKLDKPVASHVSGSMRACFRSLSWLRAHLNSPHTDSTKHINMLTTILQRAFGQGAPWSQQQQQEHEQIQKRYRRGNDAIAAQQTTAAAGAAAATSAL